MGPRLVAWSLILFGLERMFCLLIFNIGINCLTLKCWEITFLKSELPSFLQVYEKLESSFSTGYILSSHTQCPQHTIVSLPCNYQLPSLLTQLFSYDEKARFHSALQSRKRSCASEGSVPHSVMSPTGQYLQYLQLGYLTLWPWAKGEVMFTRA